jgi:alkanesulfonate monooxygenase SsuD/methylene tetrahydromethanopterin reductase-like flavin-dependent oxidoreductase (luciferase family)
VAKPDSGGIRMRVLMEPRHGARYDDILALALATERAGFDAFFRSDHLLGGDPDDPDYRPTDCWTTLAGLARDTSRVRLGALMTAATFRAPGLLAAIVASAKAGADTVYLHIFDIHDLDHIALIGAEVLPQLAALP